jgi:hypothetical protein
MRIFLIRRFSAFIPRTLAQSKRYFSVYPMESPKVTLSYVEASEVVKIVRKENAKGMGNSH